MSLFRDPVTTWQRQVLGNIQAMREQGKGPEGHGKPPPSGPGSDYDISIKPYVEDAHDADLPGGYTGNKTGTDWASHLGDTFGLSLADIPGLEGMGNFNFGFGSWQQTKDNALRQVTGQATNFVLGNIFAGDAIAVVTDRVNQDLDKRGYLSFSYPDSHEFRLPFFENPIITETRNSRYSKHVVVNRNEPWRLYTGADAKQLQIKFSLTLPHIIEFALAYSKYESLSFLIDSEYYTGFSKIVDDWILDHQGYQSLSEYKRPDTDPGWWSKKMQHAKAQLGMTPNPPTSEKLDGRTWTPTMTASNSHVSVEEEKMFAAYIQHMIDKIRTSVIGSTGKNGPIKTPPIIWVNFGTLYNNYPTIANSYNFSVDGAAGYDKNTLLPRRINISLSLEGYHQVSEQPSGRWEHPRDNPLGWDDILAIDPNLYS